MATIPVDSRLNSKTAEFFSRQHRMLIDGRLFWPLPAKPFRSTIRPPARWWQRCRKLKQKMWTVP